jgi:hypothetical protein
VAQYSPLLTDDVRHSLLKSGPNVSIKDRYAREGHALSELPLFLNGNFSFEVPVYTVWGACEDVSVLEKLRNGEYKIHNLFVIDEAHSKLLEVGGLKIRLLGLGGALVMHKLFDIGEGRSTIAGGQGTMWTTLLQIGELIDTASRNHDPTETRIFVTHASPTREGLLNQLAVAMKVDFSISAGLHFRYGSSYNEFSVNPTLDHYRGKLAASKASFTDVWETVKNEVEPAVADNEVQHRLLHYALDIINKMPSSANSGTPFGNHQQQGQVDELAFKNMWNFNLADAAFGYLVLDIEGGRLATEMRAQGFNFAHRGTRTQHPSLQADMIKPSAPSPFAGGPVPSPMSSMSGPQYNFPGPGQLPPQAQKQQGPPMNAAPAPYQQTRAQQQPQPQQGRTSQPAAATPIQPPVASKTPANASSTARSGPVSSPAPAAQAPSAAPPITTTTNTTTPVAVNGAEPKSSAVESKSAATPSTENVPPTADAAPREKQPHQPSTSIFVTNVNSEEEAKNLFGDEHKSKISAVSKRGTGGNQWLVWFDSREDQQTVYNAAPSELKGKRHFGEVKISEGFIRDSNYNNNNNRKPYEAGSSWGRDAENPTRTNGADGEAPRGRGGFGGRGRGEGRGRGGRGGRGRGAPRDAPSSSATPAATS